MFIQKTIDRNEAFADCVISLHKNGKLLPDTYVIDADTLYENASAILCAAKNNGISLYFMLKQLGRNPLIAKRLCEMGYNGPVAVDFKEALVYLQNKIRLGHVGHLVQTPRSLEKQILESKPEIVTVFSFDKAKELDETCKEIGTKQDVMLRIVDHEDVLYAGQEGGFDFEKLDDTVKKIQQLENINVAGLTSFPCFLFDESTNTINAQNNIQTLLKSKKILEANGINIKQLNMPSANCCESLPLVHNFGGTHAEPGHGLTGTTPLHAVKDCVEKPCVLYLTEVSHNYKGNAYCYGGGFYRRSHIANAVFGKQKEIVKVLPPTLDSIDYHFRLDTCVPVSESVLMAFRFQIFVTRSSVAIVEGVSKGKPNITGIFSADGHRIG